MFTPQEFRDAFPQFSEELFPAGRVQFFLTLASKSLSADRWDDLLPEGTFLYVAHYLTLEAEALKAKDGTGGMHAAAGPVVSESKTVGGVSVAKGKAGPAATGYLSGGQWNDTSYGKQFYSLLLLIGAGGLQV